MLSQDRFSYLIELSQKMFVATKSMQECYAKLPDLVAEEHAMIKAHTYTARLEEVMHEKTCLGDLINQSFEELYHCSQQVFIIWGELECEGQAAFPGDLSNSISMLDGILKSLSGKMPEFSLNVLQLQVTRLKEALIEFKLSMKEIKPVLEVNKLALSEVVTNYQMSTRVLVEMCEQAQATYNPQGQQHRPAEGTSTIFVKA